MLSAEEVAEALRAWFSPCDVLECAELQFRPYLDAARCAGFRAAQSTPLFSMQARFAGMLSTHFPYAHLVSPAEASILDEAASEARPLMTRFQGLGHSD